MIIRSLQQPGYERNQKGIPGYGPSRKHSSLDEQSPKSFEDFLTEAFEGEIVQEGKWFTSNLSDLSRKNLEKL